MPRRYKYLFEQVISLENLFAAARKAMRGKRGKAPAAGCFADLERVVVDLRDELVSGSQDPPSRWVEWTSPGSGYSGRLL